MVATRPTAFALALTIAGAVPTARAQPGRSAELPREHAPRPTTAAITAADLMTRLYIFADDSMLGRLPGTLGERRATMYLERELRRLGLTPAGEDRGYFQVVPLVSRVVSARSALSVDDTPLELWTDAAVRERQDFPPGPAQQPFAGITVVYGGPYADTTKWISGEAAAGKAVLLTRKAGDRVVLAEHFGRAAAVIFDDLETYPPSAVAAWRQPSVFLRPDSAAGAPAAVRIHVTHAVASRLFGGARLDTLLPGANGRMLRGQLTFDDSAVTARNVVAVLPGRDPSHRSEYVALTAHHDHLGYNHEPVDSDSLHAFRTELEQRMPGAADGAPVSPEQLAAIRVNVDSLRRLRPARRDSIYNGAEDDGSGSMALLEIAEALVAPGVTRPARSVLFVWHTAEELGLVGSGWYTDHPTVPRDSIVAAINVDGFGRWTPKDYQGGRGPRTHVIGARRLSTQLGDIVESVNRASRHPLLLDYTLDAPNHPDQMYCRSDHYMYARYSIPSVFVTDPLYPDYHIVSEEPQYIDYAGFAHGTRFVHDLVLRLANAARRPLVNGMRPSNPHATCVQ
jgi:hypothetical protein